MFSPLCNIAINLEIIGGIAGTLSTIAFLPQAILIWKTNSTAGISLGMYILYSCSLILWAIYAYLLNCYSLLITELVTLVIVSYILIKIIRE